MQALKVDPYLTQIVAILKKKKPQSFRQIKLPFRLQVFKYTTLALLLELKRRPLLRDVTPQYVGIQEYIYIAILTYL